jgi:hypothetical protein
MLKKVILCGAVLLSLSDADCMRTASRTAGLSPRPGAFRVVEVKKRPLASLVSSAEIMSHYCGNFHSEEDKRIVLKKGDKYRKEHPGCDHIVWGEILSGTDINPDWASRYYEETKELETLWSPDAAVAAVAAVDPVDPDTPGILS